MATLYLWPAPAGLFFLRGFLGGVGCALQKIARQSPRAVEFRKTSLDSKEKLRCEDPDSSAWRLHIWPLAVLVYKPPRLLMSQMTHLIKLPVLVIMKILRLYSTQPVAKLL